MQVLHVPDSSAGIYVACRIVEPAGKLVAKKLVHRESNIEFQDVFVEVVLNFTVPIATLCLQYHIDFAAIATHHAEIPQNHNAITKCSIPRVLEPFLVLRGKESIHM